MTKYDRKTWSAVQQHRQERSRSHNVNIKTQMLNNKAGPKNQNFKSCVLDPYSESHKFQIRQLARYSQIRTARFSQMPLFVAFERFQSRLPPRRSPQFMTAPTVAHERLCGSCVNSLKLPIASCHCLVLLLLPIATAPPFSKQNMSAAIKLCIA